MSNKTSRNAPSLYSRTLIPANDNKPDAYTGTPPETLTVLYREGCFFLVPVTERELSLMEPYIGDIIQGMFERLCRLQGSETE
ncbi:hypothetical protein P24_13478 [Oceanibaculum indicum P24]|uniref:Uncharacterized protein n=1 Tax=Oceanibaculum indicum P24 TaxID=1207063 RepID=K2IQF0_9PROT|nr:hypothetical protein P24_13478 [Oceanibaculum indicum P24]